jgi:hypothetical protein
MTVGRIGNLSTTRILFPESPSGTRSKRDDYHYKFDAVNERIARMTLTKRQCLRFLKVIGFRKARVRCNQRVTVTLGPNGMGVIPVSYAEAGSG